MASFHDAATYRTEERHKVNDHSEPTSSQTFRINMISDKRVSDPPPGRDDFIS